MLLEILQEKIDKEKTLFTKSMVDSGRDFYWLAEDDNAYTTYLFYRLYNSMTEWLNDAVESAENPITLKKLINQKSLLNDMKMFFIEAIIDPDLEYNDSMIVENFDTVLRDYVDYQDSFHC